MFLQLLQQLPQLLDLGSHAALGGTTHGRVLLHAVDNVEDLGDVAAKEGAGEAKRRGVSGEGRVPWAGFTRSVPAESGDRALFQGERPLAALCLHF